MSVIVLVSHVEMWPYVDTALLTSLSHALTAVWSSDLLLGVNELLHAASTCQPAAACTPLQLSQVQQEENMPEVSVDDLTSQLQSTWSKAEASMNM